MYRLEYGSMVHVQVSNGNTVHVQVRVRQYGSCTGQCKAVRFMHRLVYGSTIHVKVSEYVEWFKHSIVYSSTVYVQVCVWRNGSCTG